MQTVSTQREGLGALKITTALFFRPGGRSTQNDGVASNVIIPSLFAREDFGERSQDYALPGQTIEPFVSSSANGFGTDRWAPVTPELLAALAEQSSTRVLGNTEFDEVREKLEEARNGDGVVKIADILTEDESENGDGKANGNGNVANTTDDAKDDPPPGENAADAPRTADAGDEEEEDNSAQLEEALNVLTDLIRAQRS